MAKAPLSQNKPSSAPEAFVRAEGQLSFDALKEKEVVISEIRALRSEMSDFFFWFKDKTLYEDFVKSQNDLNKASASEPVAQAYASISPYEQVAAAASSQEKNLYNAYVKSQNDLNEASSFEPVVQASASAFHHPSKWLPIRLQKRVQKVFQKPSVSQRPIANLTFFLFAAR